MITLILFIIVAIFIAIKFRYNMEWDAYAFATFVGLFVVMGATLICSDKIVDKEKTEYTIIPVNGQYFTTTTDKYGRLQYNFHYKTDNAIVIANTSSFNISNDYKVVFINEVSKLGNWGWDFPNTHDTTWAVYAPESALNTTPTKVE